MEEKKYTHHVEGREPLVIYTDPTDVEYFFLEYMRDHTFPVELVTEEPDHENYIRYYHDQLPEGAVAEYAPLKGTRNKLPGDCTYQDKRLQARVYCYLKRIDPEMYYWAPIQWNLPVEYDKMAEHLSKVDEWFIGKPHIGEDALGIFLFKKKEEFDEKAGKAAYVVQKYLHNPHLLCKRKWDFRVYAWVQGVSPMTVHVSREGLLRLCPKPYTMDDVEDRYVHVSNMICNESEWDEDIPRRMVMEDALDLLQKQMPDIDVREKMWSQIDLLVRRSLEAMRPHAQVMSEQFLKGKVSEDLNGKTFQMVAYDIMFDEDLNIFLVELNKHGCMKLDAHCVDNDGNRVAMECEPHKIVKPSVYAHGFNMCMGRGTSDTLVKVYDSTEA